MYSLPIRAVMEKTAPEFTEEGDIGARFQCPVAACVKVFDADDILAVVWNHCDNDPHQHVLYGDSHLRCEMECHKGLTDTLARP